MSNKQKRLKTMKAERMERLQAKAERNFTNALHDWNAELEKAEQDTKQRMTDPAYCQSLGLPPFLPPETIEILAKAQAADRIGPKRPMRAKFHAAQGVYRDVDTPRR